MIESEEQLLEYIQELKNGCHKDDLLLFRGQTEIYDKMRSGKARPNAYIIPEVENGWNTLVGRISTQSNSGTYYNQAILQHYGFPTYYLDLTSNPLTAAWFATHEYKVLKPMMWIGNTFRYHDETTYNKIEDGIGHLIILEIPSYKKMISDNKLFDINHETKFLRPKQQDAYLMLDQPPRVPNPNSFIKEIIEIDRAKFNSSKTLKELFPHPNDDKGYANLLDVPFVQLPSYYTVKEEDRNKDEKDDREVSLDKYFVLGKRAIQIPFYTQDKNDLFDFNPKWKDTTLFEPSPFRLWKTDDFNLNSIHEGQNSIFGETTKITISPDAFYKLISNKEEIDLEWPAVNSDSIFFTRAVIDHDKVLDHSPPYIGIWLHRNNDLILEMHLISDENDELHLELGHAYSIVDNRIEYVQVEKECKCGKPEEHIKVIKSLLKIHGLIKMQEIALIQHAFFIDKWFVLL
jgi:hypothetical protein